MKNSKLSTSKSFVYLINALLIFFNTSCTSNKYHEELKTIDSLAVIVHVLNDTLNHSLFQKAERVYACTDSCLNQISSNQFNFNADTAIKQKTNLYFHLNKRLKHSLKSKKKYLIATEYSFKQLNDLSYDINNNLHSKQKIKKYVVDEKTAIDSLHHKISREFYNLEQYLSCYDTIYIEVEEFLNKH